MATVIPISAFQPNPNHPHAFGPTPNFKNLPPELKDGVWCVWYARPRKGQPGKYDKVPSNGQHNLREGDPWLSFTQARRIYERNPTRFNGIGRLCDSRHIVADVDNSDRLPSSWPATYTEVSPSGKGLRLVWRADERPPCDLSHPVEIYAGYARRFVTFTGHTVSATGAEPEPIRGSGRAIAEWVKRHRPSIEAPSDNEPLPRLVASENPPTLEEINPPHWLQALLVDGEVLPSAPSRDSSRSGVLMSAITWCYTHTSLTDSEILTLLQSHPGSHQIALDHRRGDADKALAYLWSACQRARSKRLPPAADDFTDLDEEGGSAMADGSGGEGPKTPEKVEKRKGLQFASARELLQKPAPLRWLLKGWMLPLSQVLLFGDPVTGKSLLAIDWAASIATGRPWCGRAVDKGPVIYIAGEGHHGISRRLKAWALANDCEDELADAPLEFSRVGTALIEPTARAEAIKDLDALVAKYQSKPKLIVIDTVSRNLGGDENSSEDVSRYFAIGDRLRDRYGATILHVHHSGHENKGRARGNSGFRGNTDTELTMVSKENGIKELSCPVKMKDGPLPAPISFQVQQVVLDEWFEEDGSPETSAVLVLAEGVVAGDENRRGKRMMAPRKIRTAFDSLLMALEESGRPTPEGWPYPEKEGGEVVVHRDDWRLPYMDISPLDSQASKRKAWSRAPGDLVEAGLARVWKDWYAPSVDFDCRYDDLLDRWTEHTTGSSISLADLLTEEAENGEEKDPW